ncbi:UNVERIFIED_CONTAM: hypothetical protein HHA_240380 [Hammondia hammondi]|eukprot:XP_008887870.1 hypothetical protein HHA_240380 [Hammondia hammondi]
MEGGDKTERDGDPAEKDVARTTKEQERDDVTGQQSEPIPQGMNTGERGMKLRDEGMLGAGFLWEAEPGGPQDHESASQVREEHLPHDLSACDRPFSLSKGVPAGATQEAKQHTFLHLRSPLSPESAETRSVSPDDNEGSQGDTEGGEGAGAQDGWIRVSGVRRGKDALESQRITEGPSFQQDDPTESHAPAREIDEDAFHSSNRTSLSSVPSLGRSHIALLESQWHSGRPVHFQTQNDLRLFPVGPPLSFSSPGSKLKERFKSGLTLPERAPEEGEKQLDIIPSFARLIKDIGRHTSIRLSRRDRGQPASVGEGGGIGLRSGAPGSVGTESSSEEENTYWREEVGEEPDERRVGESPKNFSQLYLNPSLTGIMCEENRRERPLELPKLSREARHGANPEGQDCQESRPQGESRDGDSATLQRTRRRTVIEGTMPDRGNEGTTHTFESVQEQGDRDASSFTSQKGTSFFTLCCQELSVRGEARGGIGKGEPVENVMSECRRNTRSSSMPARSSSSSSRIFSDSPLAEFRPEIRHPVGTTPRSSQLPTPLSSFPPRVATQPFRFRRRRSHGNFHEVLISAPSSASASSPPCPFASPVRCRKHSRGSFCSACPITSCSSVSRCTNSPRRPGGSESDPSRLSPAASSAALLSPSSSSSPLFVLHAEALSECYKEPECELSCAASSFHSESPESTCAVSRKRARRTERRGESIRRSPGNPDRVSPQLSLASPACRRIRRKSGDALRDHRTEAEARQPPRERRAERERADKSARGTTDKEEAKRREHATRPLFERPLPLSSLAVDKVSAVGESGREVENYQKTTSASEVAGQISGFKEKDIYVLSGQSGEENHAASSPSSHSHTPVSTPEVPATVGGSQCFHNDRTGVLSLYRKTGAHSQKPFTLIPAPTEGKWKEANKHIEEISTISVRETVQKYERVGSYVFSSKEKLDGVGTERENVGGRTVLVKNPSVSTPDEGLLPLPRSKRPQEKSKCEDGERDQGKPERGKNNTSSWKRKGSETHEHLVRTESVPKESTESRLPLFALYLRQPIAELPEDGKEGTGDATRAEGCRRGEARERKASDRGRGIDMVKGRRKRYGDGKQAATEQAGKEPVEEVNPQEGQRSRQAERHQPTEGDAEDNQRCSKLPPPGGAPCKVQGENTVLCGLTPLSSLLVRSSTVELCGDAEGGDVLAPEKAHTRDKQRETPNIVPVNRVDGGGELGQGNEVGGKREVERRGTATQTEDPKKAESEGEEAGMQDQSGKEDETDTDPSYESLQEKPDGVEDSCPSNCRRESDPSCLSDSQVQCLVETCWEFCRASASSSLPSSVSSSSPSEHSAFVSRLFASRGTSLSSSVSSVSSPAPISPSVATHSSSLSPSVSPRSLCSSLVFDGDVESGNEEQRTFSPASPSSFVSPRVPIGRSNGDFGGSSSHRLCFLRSSLLRKRAPENGTGDKKKRITARKAAATPVRLQSRQDQAAVSNTPANVGATEVGSHVSREEADVSGPGEDPFEVVMEGGRSIRDQGHTSACALSPSASLPRVTPSSLPLPRCAPTGLSTCSHRSSRDGLAVSLQPPLFVRVAAAATSMDMSASPEFSSSETKTGHEEEMQEAKEAPPAFRGQSEGDTSKANQEAQVSGECLGSRGLGETERQMWIADLGRPVRAEERAEVEKPGDHGQSEEQRDRGRRRPERRCALKKESQYHEADAHRTSTPSGTPASHHLAVGECHHAFFASSSLASSPSPASDLAALSSSVLPAFSCMFWSTASPRGVPLALDSDEEPAAERAGTAVCGSDRFSEEEEENQVEHYHESEGRKEQCGREVRRKEQEPGESEGGEETTQGGAAGERTKRKAKQAEQEEKEDGAGPGKYEREQDETSACKGKTTATGEAGRNEDDREAPQTEHERRRHDPNMVRTRTNREREDDALRPVTPSSFPPQPAGKAWTASSLAASRQSVSAPHRRDPDPQVVVELSDEDGDAFGNAAPSDATPFVMVVPGAEVEETSESCLTTNIGLVYSCSEEREETGHAFPLSGPPVLVTDDEHSEREVLVESAWLSTEKQRHGGACLLPSTKGGREAAGREGPKLEEAAVLLTDDDSEAEEANSSGELWGPPHLPLEGEVGETEQEAIESPSNSGSEGLCRFDVAEQRSEGEVGDRADSWPVREVDEQILSVRTGQRQCRGASTPTEISCLSLPCERVVRKTGERSEDDTATVSPAQSRFVMHPAVAAPPQDYSSSSSPSSLDKDQVCPRRVRGERAKAHGGGATEATGDIEERVARKKGGTTDGENRDRETRTEKTDMGHREGRVAVDNAAAAVPPHSGKRPGGRTSGKTKHEDRHGKCRRTQARGAGLRETEGSAVDHERRPKEHRGQEQEHLNRRDRQSDEPGKLCWRVDGSRRSDGRESGLAWGPEAEIRDGSPDAQMKRDPNDAQLKVGTREALCPCSISDEEAQSHDCDEDASGEALAFQAASSGVPTTMDIVAGSFHSAPSSRLGALHARSFAPSSPASRSSSAQVSCSVASVAQRRHSLALPLSSGGAGSVTEASGEAEVFWRRMSTGEVGAREKRSHSSNRGKREEARFPYRVGRRPPLSTPSGASFRASLSRIGEGEEGETKGREEAQMLMQSSVLPLKEEAGFSTAGKSRVPSHSAHRGASVPKDDSSTPRPVEATREGDEDLALFAGVRGERRAPEKPRRHAGSDEHERGSGDERQRRHKPGETRRSPVSRAARAQRQSKEASARLYTGGNVSVEDTRKEDSRRHEETEHRRPKQSESRDVLPLPSVPWIQRRGKTKAAPTRIVDMKQQEGPHAKGDLPTGKAGHVQRLRSVLIITEQTDDEDEQRSGEQRAERDPDRSSLRRLLQGSRLRIETDDESSEDERPAPPGDSLRMHSSQIRFPSGSSASSPSSFSSPSFSDASSGSSRETVSRLSQKRRNKAKKERHRDMPRRVPADAYSDGSVAEDMGMLRFERRTSEKKTPGRSPGREATVEETERGKSSEARASDEKLRRRGTRVFMEVLTGTDDEWGEETTEMAATGRKKFTEDSRVLSSLPGNDVYEEIDETRQNSVENGATAKERGRGAREKREEPKAAREAAFAEQPRAKALENQADNVTARSDDRIARLPRESSQKAHSYEKLKGTSHDRKWRSPPSEKGSKRTGDAPSAPTPVGGTNRGSGANRQDSKRDRPLQTQEDREGEEGDGGEANDDHGCSGEIVARSKPNTMWRATHWWRAALESFFSVSLLSSYELVGTRGAAGVLRGELPGPNSVSLLSSNWHDRLQWSFRQAVEEARSLGIVAREKWADKELLLCKEIGYFTAAARAAAVVLSHTHPAGDFDAASNQEFLTAEGDGVWLRRGRGTDDTDRRGASVIRKGKMSQAKPGVAGCFVEVKPDNLPAVWRVYRPKFEDDKVFVFDSLVLTVVHGSRRHGVSTRSARKVYANDYKGRQAAASVIYQMNLTADLACDAEAEEFLMSDVHRRHLQFARKTQDLDFGRTDYALPVCTLVDYAGQRIMVEPLMPIEPEPVNVERELVEHLKKEMPFYVQQCKARGSEYLALDAVDKVDRKVDRKMRFISKTLNIFGCPFPFGHSDFDSKCHIPRAHLWRSRVDQLCVLRNLQELLPPAVIKGKVHPTHRMRERFVQQIFDIPLPSTAAAPWTATKPENTISKFMRTTRPGSGLELLEVAHDALVECVQDDLVPTIEALHVNFLDSSDVSHALHEQGVNMKSLGLMYNRFAGAVFRDAALREMLARAAKHLFLKQMEVLVRKKAYRKVLWVELLQTTIVALFNIVLGTTEETRSFWQEQLLPEVAEIFGVDLVGTVTPRSVCHPSLFKAMEFHLGVKFEATVFQKTQTGENESLFLQLPFTPADLSHFTSFRDVALFPHIDFIRNLVTNNASSFPADAARSTEESRFPTSSLVDDGRSRDASSYPFGQSPGSESVQRHRTKSEGCTEVDSHSSSLFAPRGERLWEQRDGEVGEKWQEADGGLVLNRSDAGKKPETIQANNVASLRTFCGFFPQVKTVVPSSLGIIRTAQEQAERFPITRDISMDVKIDQMKAGLTLTRRLPMVYGTAGMASHGLNGAIRASILGVAYPCHPHCFMSLKRSPTLTTEAARGRGKTDLRQRVTSKRDTTELEKRLRKRCPKALGQTERCLIFEGFRISLALFLTLHTMVASDIVTIGKIVTQLAYVLLQHGDTRQAIAAAEYIHTRLPDIGFLHGDAKLIQLQCRAKTSKLHSMVQMYKELVPDFLFFEGPLSLRLMLMELLLAAVAFQHKQYAAAIPPGLKVYHASALTVNPNGCHWTGVAALRLIGKSLMELRRFSEAIMVLEDAVRGGRKDPSLPFFVTCMNRYWLAVALSKVGRFHDARKEAAGALVVLEDRLGENHPATLSALFFVAELDQTVGCEDIVAPPLKIMDGEDTLLREFGKAASVDVGELMLYRPIGPEDLEVVEMVARDRCRGKSRQSAIKNFTTLFRRVLSGEKYLLVTQAQYQDSRDQGTRRLLAAVKHTLTVKMCDLSLPIQRAVAYRLYVLCVSQSGSSFLKKLAAMDRDGVMAKGEVERERKKETKQKHGDDASFGPGRHATGSKAGKDAHKDKDLSAHLDDCFIFHRASSKYGTRIAPDSEILSTAVKADPSSLPSREHGNLMMTLLVFSPPTSDFANMLEDCIEDCRQEPGLVPAVWFDRLVRRIVAENGTPNDLVCFISMLRAFFSPIQKRIFLFFLHEEYARTDLDPSLFHSHAARRELYIDTVRKLIQVRMNNARFREYQRLKRLQEKNKKDRKMRKQQSHGSLTAFDVTESDLSHLSYLEYNIDKADPSDAEEYLDDTTGLINGCVWNGISLQNLNVRLSEQLIYQDALEKEYTSKANVPGMSIVKGKDTESTTVTESVVDDTDRRLLGKGWISGRTSTRAMGRAAELSLQKFGGQAGLVTQSVSSACLAYNLDKIERLPVPREEDDLAWRLAVEGGFLA